MAQMIFKHLAKTVGRENDFEIDSAATDYDAIGCPIHRGTRNALIRNQIPFEEHYARKITESDFQKFDFILCMDDENIEHIAQDFGRKNAEKVKKLLSFCGESRDVRDPWYTHNFDETFEDILRGCTELLKSI